MMRLPVADDQGMAPFISEVAQGLHILFHLNFQGCRNHPTRAFPGQVIQRFHDFRSLSFCVICDKLIHGVSFLRPRPPLLGLYSPKGYAAFLILSIHNF